MSTKTRAGLVVGAFLVGTGVGSCTIMVGDSGVADEAAPPAPTPVKTKTVTEYKERRVEALPNSCREALGVIKDVKSSEGDLMNVFIRGSDILSDGHEALTMKDGGALNVAREKLYKLDGESNTSAQDLTLKLWPRLERHVKDCRETDAYKGGE